MQQPLIKHIITFLFLVAFLVPRVANLHGLEHLAEEDDAISCELCDIASQSHQLDLYVGNVSFEDNPAVTSQNNNIVEANYNSPIAKIVTPISVYNKPPPVI